MNLAKRVVLLIAIGLCLQLGWYAPVQSEAVKYKELNFVFLHGAGGNVCSMQRLADNVIERMPDYIADYQQDNPGIEVRAGYLLRCYPNDVDIESWAENIAASVDEYLPGKRNLVLVGHSVGGKAALYAVAHNVGGLADKTLMVATINSPIRSLHQYYFTGGASLEDYYRTLGLISDRGVSDSVVNYDSAEDGGWVAANKHWLAFISAESAPFSPQYDVGGVDTMPRNMDDNIIPISAQHTARADVVYYGEHSHNDFADSDEVAGFLAGQILRYIFGGEIDCSVLARGGRLEHAAGWLPGTEHWEDVVGEILVSSGTLEHKNEAFFSWQDWEDVVGESPVGTTRSSYRVVLDKYFPLVNSIEEVRWLSPDDSGDCQLYLKTRAAPRNSVRVDWEVYQVGLLVGTERAHYEVEIVTGTPLTTVRYVYWLTGDPRDPRLRISSEAESPFRWFRADWRVYAKESRYRQVIGEIATQVSLVAEADTEVNNCCD